MGGLTALLAAAVLGLLGWNLYTRRRVRNLAARFVDDNTLSVHISRLREKVGAEHIRTVRGVGYQWVD